MKVSGITASYYWVQDLDRATTFYTDLLGAAPTTALPDIFSEWVFPDDTSFGLYHGENFHTSDGVMFVVENVNDAIADLKAQGKDVVRHVEETGVCWMGFGTDTEGNGFILHQRK